MNRETNKNHDFHAFSSLCNADAIAAALGLAIQPCSMRGRNCRDGSCLWKPSPNLTTEFTAEIAEIAEAGKQVSFLRVLRVLRGEPRFRGRLYDARGVPVAVDTASATPHESKLVQGLFDFMLTTLTPDRVIGDKAYDSDKLDDELAARGTDLIAPHRANRKSDNITQDGRRLRRYKRRWKVERTIAWFQNFRRLCIRYEKSAKLFQGFLHLGCSILLLKQVYG